MLPSNFSSLTKSSHCRSASLAIALFGVVTNSIFTLQVLAAWRSFKWEPESEWEASVGRWTIDGVKVIWLLLFAYFASAASVCTTGLIGIAKHKPSLVRAYRDYSIVDFSFCTFFTLLATYGAFQTSARAGVCEELSHHPELLRDVLEMGLNLENCERWLERAVLAFVAFMVILTVIRLHFLLAVSRYYSYLARHDQATASVLPTYRDIPDSDGVIQLQQRILLLPRSPSEPLPVDYEEDYEPVIYAPIPMSSLPAELAQDLRDTATEALVTQLRPSASQATAATLTQVSSSFSHHHSHRAHRHHRHGPRRSSRSSSSDSLPSYKDVTIKV